MPGQNSRYTPPKSEQERLVAIGDGMLVERDVLNIVEKIQAYDPSLKVKYLDPDRATDLFDAPYLVVESCPDGFDRIVTQAWTIDDQLYDRIVMADTFRGQNQDWILKELDRKNAAAKAESTRKQIEKTEAVREMVVGVLKSSKDTYTATNPVTGASHKFTSLPQEKAHAS